MDRRRTRPRWMIQRQAGTLGGREGRSRGVGEEIPAQRAHQREGRLRGVGGEILAQRAHRGAGGEILAQHAHLQERRSTLNIGW